MACAMRSLPCNGGVRSSLLGRSAGSAGLLAGEVQREVLHRRLHQPRPLFASRQAYYPGHRILMIVYHLTPSAAVCQFPFCGFCPGPAVKTGRRGSGQSKRARRLSSADGGPSSCVGQKNFFTPSGARDASSLMVMVNLMLCRSANLFSQSRNCSVSLSHSPPTILVKLSMKTWVMS